MIHNRRTAVIGMIITSILWSTGGLLIKSVTGHPIAIASARAGIAAIVMLVYVGFKFHKPNKAILFGTLFYSITIIGFVTATKLTTAANAVLLQYIAPVWVAILARVFLKDKLRRSDIVSIIVLLIGLQLFFLEKLSAGMLLGNIIAIITSISFASFFIIVKTLKKEEVIYPILYGNIISFFIGLPFYTTSLISTTSLINLILLGVFQIGLAYIIYAKSMVYLKAMDAILIPMVEPLLNPLWVFLIIGETPTYLSIIGGIIVLSSVIGRSVYQTKVPLES